MRKEFLIQSSMNVTKADQCRTTLGHTVVHSKLRRLRQNKTIKCHQDIQYFLSCDRKSLSTVHGQATPSFRMMLAILRIKTMTAESHSLVLISDSRFFKLSLQFLAWLEQLLSGTSAHLKHNEGRISGSHSPAGRRPPQTTTTEPFRPIRGAELGSRTSYWRGGWSW